MPELKALFEDVKQIAPRDAYDLIGYAFCIFIHTVINVDSHMRSVGRDSTLRFGSCQPTIFRRLHRSMKKSLLHCVRSVARKIPDTLPRTVLQTEQRDRGHTLTAYVGIGTPVS